MVDVHGAVGYEALARAARAVTRALSDARVEQGDRIGVLVARDAAVVAAIHGVLAAGAAYVPVDPAWPAERQGLMLRDCGVSAVVATTPGAADVAGLLEVPFIQVKRRDLDLEVQAGTGPGSLEEGLEIDPAATAYVLYTSGTTGRPRGVVVTHAAARAFVDWAVAEFAVTDSDVIGGHAPFTFDISTFDLFASASTGATLVLVPTHLSAFPVDLADFIAVQEISVWYSVPYPLARLTELGIGAKRALRTLRAVMFAGEVFPPDQLATLIKLTPRARHANLYGPTESNVCTFWIVEDAPVQEAPIGRAITGDICFLREEGEMVTDRVGSVGELWVAGATLAQGYWGASASPGFEVDPGVPGGRVYRTGDIVRIVAPGVFHYVGRKDDMVKIRGVRLHLSEIEQAALSAPWVSEACAVVLPDARAVARLALAVTATSTDTAELLAVCRRILPPAAVPEFVMVLDALPRTANGKVDRQAILAAATSAAIEGRR